MTIAAESLAVYSRLIDLNAQIESAIDANDAIALKQSAHELRELLFFVEGRSA